MTVTRSSFARRNSRVGRVRLELSTMTTSKFRYVVNANTLSIQRANRVPSLVGTMMLTSGPGSGHDHETRLYPDRPIRAGVRSPDRPVRTRWSITARRPAPTAYCLADSTDAVEPT